jgi:putative membrane protein
MIDWRHWHNEPFLIGGLILAGWLHAVLAGPFRSRLDPAAPYPARKAALFYGALLLFYLAVGSPLDQVSERFLLSAHMVQHLLILYPVPLMILLGTPAWMADPLLRLPALRPGLRMLLHPAACAVLWGLVVSLCHMPFIYEWTLENKLAHVGEHLLFLAVSLLYWWPLASPSAEFPRPSLPLRMIYIIATDIAMIPVSAYLVFSGDILYRTYEYAPRLIAGFSPADDQLVAGIIMKFSGMAVSFAAFAHCFYLWSRGTGGPPKKKAPGPTDPGP